MVEKTPQPSEVAGPGSSSTAITIDTQKHPSTSTTKEKPNQDQLRFRSKRSKTNLDEVPIETRIFKHAHIIRRPRALQYYKPEDGVPPPFERPSKLDSSSAQNSNGEERSTDNLFRQLNRLDLFVDLVWVGIIANLSHTFGEQAFSDSGIGIGSAFLEFMLLFIPIWRLWDQLRSFGSHFYNDDALQRQFICWILVLAVLYGINAPYAFRPHEEKNSLKLLISTYLVARGSFVVAHGVQAFFMPFLRRQFLVILTGTLVSSSLWIPAIWLRYPYKIALLVLANLVEHPFDILIASPLGERLITDGWKKIVHFDHYIERYEGFFIIILGEGVFRLVDGSPSGLGLNGTAGTVLTVLLMYYMIHYLYFNGDQAKEFVHALRRTWWRGILWQMSHVSLFAALLVLASSTLFLVESRNSPSGLEESSPLSERSEEIRPHYLVPALWTASTSLSVVIINLTSIALLNYSLDKPGTLVVNSRYMRLAPRLLGITVIMCLPLIKGVRGTGWCVGSMLVLWSLFMWEWLAGLEKRWSFFEGKED